MNIINTVKITGTVLVVLGGAILAYMLNSKAKCTLTRTEGFISLLRYIKTQVDCYSMPLSRILENCNDSIYSDCGYVGEKKPNDLSELISGCPSLDGRALKIMSEFSEEFGKSYRGEQVKLCDRCIDELAILRTEVSEGLPLRRKLNSTLCMSGAMAIVILLI